MKIHHLSISWTVSRGRDTYGYNICRLDSRQSGSRYKCMGGGYDMVGKVFGDWLECEYQRELVSHVESLPKIPYGNGKRLQISEEINPSYYGLTIREDGSVSLDGACGFDSMRRIANALGLEIEYERNRRGNTVGYYVSPKAEEALPC